MGTATLEFVLKDKSATTWTTGAASLAASSQFAADMQTYSNAAIRRVGYTESVDLTNEERSDDFADISLYGMAFFRDEAYNIVKFVWPAPRQDLFTLERSRYLLNKTHGDAIATKLGTLKGKTLTFKHGSICSR